MPADKLGRYMTSPEFLRHANAAVGRAVRALEAKGIAPAYITRPIGTVPDVDTQAVIDDLLRGHERAELRRQIHGFYNLPGGPERVRAAVRAVASALLLAKTAMATENDFIESVAQQLAQVSQHPALSELGMLMVQAETNTTNDVFRDPTVISNALFARRMEAILQALRR
jgi:hypothetical protein